MLDYISVLCLIELLWRNGAAPPLLHYTACCPFTFPSKPCRSGRGKKIVQRNVTRICTTESYEVIFSQNFLSIAGAALKLLQEQRKEQQDVLYYRKDIFGIFAVQWCLTVMAAPGPVKHLPHLHPMDAKLHTPLGDQLNLTFLLFTPPQIRRGRFQTMGRALAASPPSLASQLQASSKECVNTLRRGKDVTPFREPRHRLPWRGRLRKAGKWGREEAELLSSEMLCTFGLYHNQ